MRAVQKRTLARFVPDDLGVTQREFLVWAEAAGIDPQVYRLSSSAVSEVYVVERSSGGWAVFYSERGNRNSEMWHATESQALEDLKSRLDRDPTTRKARRRGNL